MNEKFFELSEERQNAIIQAAMEVFAMNDYKRASTEEIAIKAGISKGLLFYYFKDKKTLYIYIFNKFSELIKESMLDSKFYEITDFFELIYYATQKKLELSKTNPYILDFSIRSYYSEFDEVSEKIKESYKITFEQSFSIYFKNVDMSKFKNPELPFEIYKMLYWLSTGYMDDKHRNNEKIIMEDMIIEFDKWKDLFKKMSYKEEYLT